MTAVRGGWLALLTITVVALAAPRTRGAGAAPGALGSDLLQRLPAEVVGAFSVDHATQLRQSELGTIVSQWMAEPQALPQTQRAWGLFASRLGVSETEAFDGLLGGCAVLAFARRDAQAPVDWIVLAAVESAMDVRMLRRTRAVPRKIVHGRALLGLEEESFLLSTLPPMEDGRSVLALAPAGAEWLLVRTLAVSAGKANPLMGDPLQGAPLEAPVRGFWRPQNAPGVSGDIERLLWGPDERGHTLSIWATAQGSTVEINFSPLIGGPAEPLEPTDAAAEVLLEVAGPGQAIVSGVLERAGLVGVVPEGLAVSRDSGELVVRRGAEGIELGARLPIMSTSVQADAAPDRPVANLRQARVRELSETPASAAIFGPRAQLAWTVLDGQTARSELLLAVTAGPGLANAPPSNEVPAEPRAVSIIAQALSQPGPVGAGILGSARPHALWSLLRPASEGAGAGGSGPRGGVASLASMVERARWAVEMASGAVRGRIVLELREAASK